MMSKSFSTQWVVKQRTSTVGSARAIVNILKDLRRRKADWLRNAAKKMAKELKREWLQYNEIRSK
jgi:hypothetical protein